MIRPNYYLNDIELYKPGKSIDEVQKELNLKKVVKLASNENPFGTSDRVKKVIVNYLNNLHRYPDGNCAELKKKLSKKIEVDVDEIIIGNGSDEIIDLTIKAYLSNGDEILTCEPTFSYYRISARSSGSKYRAIPLKNYRFDVVGLLNSISYSTKIIIFCNPNNPTGTFVKEDELSFFIENISDDKLVIIDEAYFEFYDKDKIVNSVDLIKKYPKKNILVLRTFSKIYGLAGLRIGYGISKKEIIENLNKVKPPFNVNYLAQISAIEALEDEEFVNKTYENNLECKKILYNFFENENIFYLPSQTNFIFFDPELSNEMIFKALLMEGIIIRSLKNFGYETALRVSIGKKDEIEFFIEKFKKVFYKLGKEMNAED